MALVPLKNAVQHYAWGSRSMLPDLFGRMGDEEPIAELWMGAHRKAPRILLLPDGTVSLDLAISQDCDRWLGGAIAQRFQGEFPFLLKLLSAEKGLSIQAHPNKREAEIGFDRENRQEIPLDAPHRNYRDRNHKPELLVPLTEFYGLSGFRREEEIGSNLQPLLEGARIGKGAVPSPEEAGLQEWFSRWMGLDESAKEALVAAALREIGEPRQDRDDPRWWVVELHRQFPGDFGVLSPLFLNLLHLQPGEGIFLSAGLLHAYLYGAGVEIMANSDNVLRSGCTQKHVDPEELLRVLTFRPGGVERVPPFPVAPGIEIFRTPAEEFELLRISSDGSTRRIERSATLRPPLLIVATDGQPTLFGEGLQELTLEPGESAYVTPGTAEVTMSGEGTVYCAAPAGGLYL